MDANAPETSDLARLYTFAVWMTGDRATALATAAELVKAAPGERFAHWAMALLAQLGGPKGHPADRRMVLDSLDELLRTDLTVTAGDHPQVRRDPRRLRVLQWELKRSCLSSVMRGVTPSPRAAFILHRIFGYSREQVGAMLGITLNAVGINLGRAESVLDGYLGARCQHMAPGNSCRCETRLGVALARGFVGWPEHADAIPDAPVSSGKPADVGSVYASLPAFSLDQPAMDMLSAARGAAE